LAPLDIAVEPIPHDATGSLQPGPRTSLRIGSLQVERHEITGVRCDVPPACPWLKKTNRTRWSLSTSYVV